MIFILVVSPVIYRCKQSKYNYSLTPMLFLYNIGDKCIVIVQFVLHILNHLKIPLLCYNNCRSLLVLRFCPVSVQSMIYIMNSLVLQQLNFFLRWYISSVFHFSGNVSGWVPVCCLRSVAKDSALVIHDWG